VQLADPNVCGLSASPQNDGISNLLKYLYNINPARPMTSNDCSALPTSGFQMIGGTRYLTLNYRRNATLNAILVSVQSSSDLRNWTTISNPTVVQVGTDATTNDPIMQVQVAATGAVKFLRLTATSF
jgi:hypothetical protein